jgi:uncharacterized protein (DUF302 family)
VNTKTELGLTVRLAVPYEEAVARATAALKEQGFGVLTEIDVKATMKKKLDVDFQKYVILGACNPPLAYRALSAVPDVGLLLPCNVIVYEDANRGGSVVSIVDPLGMLGFLNEPELAPVAAEARARLEKVARALTM